MPEIYTMKLQKCNAREASQDDIDRLLRIERGFQQLRDAIMPCNNPVFRKAQAIITEVRLDTMKSVQTKNPLGPPTLQGRTAIIPKEMLL
jgi:hypothetical protein